jgi:hypothetical protein
MTTANDLIDFFNKINEHPKLYAETYIFNGQNAIKIQHRDVKLYMAPTNYKEIKDAVKELSKY